MSKKVFTQAIVILTLLARSSSAQFNPSILQDTRNEPKRDGAYGFLYRTEDGIAHAAKADPGGVVHGRFTYTDPTGLKVNFNYNAGSQVTPGYTRSDSTNNQPQQYEQQDQYVRRTKPPALQSYQPPLNNPPPLNNQQPQNYQQDNNNLNYNNNNYNSNDNYQMDQNVPMWSQQQLRHPLEPQSNLPQNFG